MDVALLKTMPHAEVAENLGAGNGFTPRSPRLRVNPFFEYNDENHPHD